MKKNQNNKKRKKYRELLFHANIGVGEQFV